MEMRSNQAWRTGRICIAVATASIVVLLAAANDAPPMEDWAGAPVAPVVGNKQAPDSPPIPPLEFRGVPIYSNSGNLADPFVITRPIAGCGGLAVSDLQTALGLNAVGFNCVAASPITVADDFVVPAAQTWAIDQVVLYLYQPNVTGPSITGVNLRLQSEDPLGQSVPSLTSYVPSTTWSNVYKNKDTDAPGSDCTRRLQQCVITLVPPYLADTGTHYLIWQASGTGSSGPWAPPVVVPGATNKPGANALVASSISSGLFQPIVDSGTAKAPQDLVFVLRGTVTGPASTGDLNCDGVISYADINPFVLALSSQTAYEGQYPGCRWMNADINGDGAVSYADINPFVQLLGNPPQSHPGDMNCDGTVSYADINPFVLALGGQNGYQTQYPNCRWMNADVNADGVVSYADINGFVALLGG
jgi:hypothetical protein